MRFKMLLSKNIYQMTKIVVLIFFIGILFNTNTSWACSVCGDAPENYRFMVVFLSILPLIIIGLLTWLVIRKSKKITNEK